MARFFCFSIFKVFCQETTNLVLGDQFLNQFQNSNFKIRAFEVKIISQKSQNDQNNLLTNHWVKWTISKVTKIRD